MEIQTSVFTSTSIPDTNAGRRTCRMISGDRASGMGNFGQKILICWAIFRSCKGVVAAWGLGGEAFSFPAEAGYPVGEEHGGATYFMFEVHYDNPGYHSGIVDSSGLEIMLTPKLRRYDSGLMAIGHDVSSLHLIPPGLDHYTTVGHCPDFCTTVKSFYTFFHDFTRI